MDHPIHLGWGKKQGQAVKSWKRRFFVLTERQLSYYKNELAATVYTTSQRKGQVPINQHIQVRTQAESPEAQWPPETKPHTGFCIKSGQRTLYVFCSSVDEANHWITILKELKQQYMSAPRSSFSRKPSYTSVRGSDDDEEEDDETTRQRLKTQVFQQKKHDELALIAKQLSLRNCALNDQLESAEVQVAEAESAYQYLELYTAYLQQLLRDCGISFLDQGEWREPEPEEIDFGSGFDADMEMEDWLQQERSTDQKREQAAIRIQNWYRSNKMSKMFNHIRQGADHRGRLRTMDQRRGTTGGAAAVNGTSQQHLHQRRMTETTRLRLPSTSLGTSLGTSGKLTALTASAGGVGIGSKSQTNASASVLGLPTGSSRRATTSQFRRASFMLPLSETQPVDSTSSTVEAHDDVDSEEDFVDVTPLEAMSVSTSASAASTVRAIEEPSSRSSGISLSISEHLDHEEAVDIKDHSSTTAGFVSGSGPVTRPSMSRTEPSLILSNDDSLSMFEPPSASTSTMSLAYRHARVAMYRFNKKPTKGIHDLIASGVVTKEPEIIVKFLAEEPGVSRSMVGEFLGDPSEFSRSILNAYAATFDFANSPIDECLRLFLLAFRIPGEAQKIERVLTAFANSYFAANPKLFAHQDTALVLAFSIMMLHTDLHNPSNPRRMTMPEFIRNNRGIDDGSDIDKVLLENIYQRIARLEFKCCIDHTLKVESLAACMQDHKIRDSLVTEMRQFETEVSVDELYRKKDTKATTVKRKVTLLLFNDLLLITEKSRGKKSYKHKRSLELASVRLRSTPFYDSHQREDGLVCDIIGGQEVKLRVHLKATQIQFANKLADCIQLCEDILSLQWDKPKDEADC
eukprot:m.29468 g.29468  ORF g.29468 m.29468 type:complete len:858 (-) comp9170_c1_seq1:1817-4390(-)